MMSLRPHTGLLVAILVAGCASGAVAPPPGERGIVVTGTGRVAQRPDAATVAIGVEARGAQLADATGAVDRAMREVLARVRALGVRDADVRTVEYAIDPIPEPRRPAETGTRIMGYRVTNVVQVRTHDVDAVGRLVDTAVAGGANVVRHVHFTLADPARAEAEARTLAVRDARASALQLAAAAGVTLGRLLSLRESSPVRPVARMAAVSAPGPVEAGELEVVVTLEARYAIEP